MESQIKLHGLPTIEWLYIDPERAVEKKPFYWTGTEWGPVEEAAAYAWGGGTTALSHVTGKGHPNAAMPPAGGQWIQATFARTRTAYAALVVNDDGSPSEWHLIWAFDPEQADKLIRAHVPQGAKHRLLHAAA